MIDLTSKIYHCPACDGAGQEVVFFCCGQTVNDECCCSPLPGTEVCVTCKGGKLVSLDEYKEVAIAKRDLALIAQFESLYLLAKLAEGPLERFKKVPEKVARL